MKNLILTFLSSIVLTGGVFTAVLFFDSSSEQDFYYIVNDGYVLAPDASAGILPGSKASKQPVSLEEDRTVLPGTSFSSTSSPFTVANKVSKVEIAASPVVSPAYTSSGLSSNNSSNTQAVPVASGYAESTPLLATAVSRGAAAGSQSYGLANRMASVQGAASVSTLSFPGGILPPAEEGEDDLNELPLNGGEFILLLLAGVYIVFNFRKKYKFL